jgi:hypothetical protein
MKKKIKPYVYRIEVEEKYNGKKTYAPQAKVGFKWKNVVRTPSNNYELSSNAKESYYNEESALDIINKHARSILEKISNEVKSVSYIEVEY